MPKFIIECVEHCNAVYEIETEADGSEGANEAMRKFLTVEPDKALRRDVKGTKILSIEPARRV